jgi:hypothetical protein
MQSVDWWLKAKTRTELNIWRVHWEGVATQKQDNSISKDQVESNIFKIINIGSEVIMCFPKTHHTLRIW